MKYCPFIGEHFLWGPYTMCFPKIYNMHSPWWFHIFAILKHFHLLVREWGEGADLKSESINFFKKYQFILSLSFNFFWEQECETETYSISLKASVVTFASIFQINFFLVRSLALILPLFFAVVFLPLMFCPCPFFALKFCPCPQNVSKKEGKGKISFLPSDSFPHVFCPQILPLPLPSFFALVFRAKKEGKGKGKIWGQNTWGNESEGKKEGKTRNY